MDRRLEPVDAVVAIGLLVTLLGGYLMFMATGSTLGTIQATSIENVGVTPALSTMGARDFVQPVLGKTIVEDYLHEINASQQLASSEAALGPATMVAYRVQNSPFGHLDRIKAQAAIREVNHAGRVQF